ncbi:WGR domain-containing protein, partial [Flavihumibacter sp. CACIAM 22H1]|uniref:WGR domain-containing protein n=1 Tax=Flavihumibacter sp. CACIAM 22H1 TaxID=1812911 RepID=UPI0025C1AB5B
MKQTILYFKEGNSDKTYEIDLCELGFDRYIVNFRYGRRGGQLKEGSKTPVPVSLTEAEKIFDAVETEKMQKGYTTNPEAVSTIAAKAVFTLQNLPPVSLDWQSLPPGKEKAILQRLHNAVTKQPASNRTKWKLSRVVWKAGAAQLKDAVPYLTHLFNQQESMLQYSCCWALARSGNPSAIPALQQIFTAKPSKLLSQLAGAGLLKLLEGLERDQHIQHFHNSLPDSFKAIIDRRQETELDKLVQERISEVEPSYPWIEKLYLLSFDKKWIRPVVKNLLQRIELKAGYFKHIRTIYKWAEMLNDFEVLGLLSSRFEREPQQYTHFLSAAERKKKNTYIPLLEDYVKLSVEQAKTTTKLAYSNKTRNYLHRRTLKNLIATGKANNTDYVKLATALLISYTKNLDEKEAYTEYTYSWINNRYQRIELRFPANAQAVYLHQILNGNNAAMKLVSGNRYQFITEAVRTAKSPDEQSSGIVQFITRLFRRNKPAAQLPATPPIPPVSEKDAAIPFLHLWNQMPQAYIQLLIDAELEQVHQFAAHQLAQHPRYAELIQKIDVSTAIRLIGSAFALPAEFGFNLVKARFPQGSKDINLLLALLNCPIDNARATARRWVEAEPNDFITAADFMIPVLFSIQDDTRNWGKDLPKNKFLPDATKELL